MVPKDGGCNDEAQAPDRKGWSTPDIIMEERQIELSTEPAYRFFLPLITKG
jgi:hypothetical protein